MKIAIGSDHAGFSLKEQLRLTFADHDFVDFGTYSEASCDYPDVALKVAHAIRDGEADLGVLVCGTGVGMAIAANKVQGIRAAACSETYTAKLTRDHNNANVLCIGSRVVSRRGRGDPTRLARHALFRRRAPRPAAAQDHRH